MSVRTKICFLFFLSATLLLWNCGDDEPAQNLPPSISDQSFTVSEAITPGSVIGRVTATDEEGDPLTLSISTNDNGLFAITTSGELSLAAGQSLDFEMATSHSITVQVSDGTNESSATITLNVMDVDENTMPTIDPQSFTVAEDINDMTAIGTVMASDAEGDGLTYSIMTNDNDLFEISADLGELSLAMGQNLDFETATSHTIMVQVSDGSLTATAEITINVTDVDENTAPTLDNQEFTVAEDIADDVVIGTVMATDAEDDDLAFSITTNSGDLFEITEAGELSLVSGQNLDFETATSHTITVEVSDGALTGMAEITIKVTDVDEAVYVGTVTTIAGNGDFGFDNGPGLTAAFSVATGIEVTSTGEILIADRGNNVIRHIDQNLEVTTFAGSGVEGETDGTFANARFDLPTGVVTNNAGLVYVVDMRNHRIRQLGPGEDVTTVAGSTPGLVNGALADAQFSVPWDIVIDSNGDLFITDTNNHRIRKIDVSTGQVSTFAGTGSTGVTQGGFLNGPADQAQFRLPRGIAIDANDNLYIADTGNHRIRKITPDGTVTTLAGTGVLGLRDGAPDEARFREPTGIAVDVNGVVYVVDQNNNSIRRVEPNGKVTTIAGDGTFGDSDGVGAAARFGTPEGIAIGPDGALYVTDLNNSLIRKIVVSQE